MKSRVKKRIIICFLVLLFGLALFFLAFEGILRIYPGDEKYPIKGVDVSSYQGQIDFKKLCESNISFVYIKATEGSSSKDSCFNANLDNAISTPNLYVGAYHFFSFESEGKTQAQNFTQTVPKKSGMLPPMVDVEFYGGFNKNNINKADITESLTEYIKIVKEYYGVEPIIYSTKSAYDALLSGGYNENGIFIRSVFSAPSLSDKKEPLFWQYSGRGKLSGYSGAEKFIDLDVFCGTKEELQSLLIT